MDVFLDYENLAPESAHLVKALMDPYYPSSHQDSVMIKNMDWIASKDFTANDGKRQIHEYITTWELSSSWLYSLDYLGVTKEQYFSFYHYRARFSTPSSRSPVVGTASVYFTVHKVDPETQPVDVHYVIESNRLVHRAGTALFREKWLRDVIDSKTLLRKRVQDLWTDSGLDTMDGATS